jgi:hypothetical protein
MGRLSPLRGAVAGPAADEGRGLRSSETFPKSEKSESQTTELCFWNFTIFPTIRSVSPRNGRMFRPITSWGPALGKSVSGRGPVFAPEQQAVQSSAKGRLAVERPEGRQINGYGLTRIRELGATSPNYYEARVSLEPGPRTVREATMPTGKRRASTILGAFDQAQTELLGKAVILTDGKAGTVEQVLLDEQHGLRISIRGHYGKWPVSTVKLAQS